MPSFEFKWEIAGEAQLPFKLDGLAQELHDFKEPLRELGELIYREDKAQFDAEGRPPWEKLSPGYARWKEKHYPGKPIMQRTGALVASLTGKSAEGSVYRLTADGLEVGTGLMVGKWNLGLLHQKPTEGARPQRRLMNFDERGSEQAMDIFTRWFRRKAREAGVGYE